MTQNKLKIIEYRIARYEPAYLAGSISINEWENVNEQKETLLGEIDSIESRVKEIKNQIAAKESEIDVAIKKKQERLTQVRADLALRVRSKQTTQQELEAVRVEVESRMPFLNTLKREVERLQYKEQKNQANEAKIGGVVISQDLHKRLGKTMEKGEIVL